MSETAPPLKLVFRVDSQICALPLTRVSEVLRPLPVEPLAGAPSAVRGLSIVRGAPIPVVDLALLLHGKMGAGGRLVIVRAGERLVAVSVDAVLGIREISGSLWSELPPLLREACPGVVENVAALDQECILALQSGGLVPGAVWESLSLRGG